MKNITLAEIITLIDSNGDSREPIILSFGSDVSDWIRLNTSSPALAHLKDLRVTALGADVTLTNTPCIQIWVEKEEE